MSNDDFRQLLMTPRSTGGVGGGAATTAAAGGVVTKETPGSEKKTSKYIQLYDLVHFCIIVMHQKLINSNQEGKG